MGWCITLKSDTDFWSGERFTTRCKLIHQRPLESAKPTRLELQNTIVRKKKFFSVDVQCSATRALLTLSLVLDYPGGHRKATPQFSANLFHIWSTRPSLPDVVIPWHNSELYSRKRWPQHSNVIFCRHLFLFLSLAGRHFFH